jgi:hypothetical protein
MPDEVLDTVGNDPQDAGTVDGSATETNSNYLLTYRTREEAEKGWTEKDFEINRLKADRDKVRAERDKAMQTKEILEQLKGVMGSDAKPKDEAPKFDRAALAKHLDDGGGEAILDTLERVTQHMEQVAEQKATAKTAALYTELATMREQLLELHPEFQRVDREKVSQVQERYGVSREVAMKIVSDQTPKVKIPPSPPLAGNSAGGSALRGDAPKLDSATLSFLENIQGIGKLSDSEKAALARGI